MPPIISRSPASRRPSGRSAGTCAVTLAVTTLVAVPAQAEDIDVYRARLAAQQKPNVLFVLDYSGSMDQDIEGGEADASGLPRKIDVLRAVMDDVLSANAGKMRAGIGSIYAREAGGVRWPISELDADAHDIDPAIPENAHTAREIMLEQLVRQDARGSTRTVNALAEAALYFRGATVANGGITVEEPFHHEPDRWSVTNDRYEGGNPGAAIEASYVARDDLWTPGAAYWQEAYAAGVNESGNYGWCVDRTESGGSNECAGKTLVDPVAECYRKPGGRYTRDAATLGTGSRQARTVCLYEHPDAWRGATYDSPIEGECSTNAIVLISDGLPDKYSDNAALREVLGTTGPASCENLHEGLFAGTRGDWNGDCGPELVRKLATEPQVAGIADSTVKTFTVGFGVGGVGQDYLERLASEGGGASYAADDARTLAEALGRITEEIVGDNESFVELSIDIDRTSFSHGDRAYFNLFTPSGRRGWSGNLKGYFLGADGFEDTNGDVAVVADDDGPRFADTAQSFWSENPDGDTVSEGGASEQLVAGGRTLYTYLDDAPTGTALSFSAANALVPHNTAITAAQLGTDETARTAALEWLQTAPMGDPLHSKSVSVAYGDGTDIDRQVVYVMTNQGLLHAIDATAPSSPGEGDRSGGEELFAFMPKRLLENLPALATGEAGADHVYGLDGGTTRWHDDTDGDGVVDSGESMLLVVGMRRGGEAYYALDVSDPERPALAWRIDSDTPGFEGLAQTWSRPSLVRVRQGDDGERQVLMFGGGYDPALDGEEGRMRSGGNAVFVVDRNGDRVAKFTHEKMEYAMPADLTAIDSDADGLADRLYAVDLGAQVWRIDFDDPGSAVDSTVTRLADLSGNRHQPFFFAPSVALNRGAGGDYLSVAIGSGNRTAPLDDGSANALFMLRDTDVDKGAPADSFRTIGTNDLYDATANLLGSANTDVASGARTALARERGWRVNLGAGEKSLSRLVSFGGELFATTFTPDPSGVVDPCTFAPLRRYYRMDLGTAVPSASGDGLEGVLANPARRWRLLEGTGIPSAPVPIFPKGSDTGKIVIGSEVKDTFTRPITRVYWHAK